MSAVEPSTDYAPTGRPLTGPKVFLMILGFFGVIIAANMTLLFSALGTFGGLVTPNSYVASQLFEEDQSAQRSAAISGWDIEVVQAAGGAEGARVALRIQAGGAPLSGVDLAAAAGRPTHERADQAIAFREAEPGLFVSTEPLAYGQWRLTLAAARADGGVERRTVRALLRRPRG